MEDVAGRMARAPKGAGIGVGLLGALGAAAYGLYQSVYTGNCRVLTTFCKFFYSLIIHYSDFNSLRIQFFICFYLLSIVSCFFYVAVEGGHRAIIFNRLTGVQKDIYKEGIHFR